MNAPLVSICVPIYGVEKYIERCARSLFGQTYQNIQYVFVNDCTKDASIDILQNVLNDYPNRLNQVKIVHHKKNLGLGGARNSAIENVQGDFLMWVDSDDYIDLECVSKLVGKLVVTDADIVACDVFYDYETHKEISQQRLSNNPKQECLDICSCRAKHMVWGRLIRTSLYRDNHISVRLGCDMGEDRQVVPKLYYFAKKTAVLKEPLYYYFNGNVSAYSASFSTKKAEQWLLSTDIVTDFFKDKPEEYRVALEKGSAIMLAELMMGCVRCANKDAYAKIRMRMNEISEISVKAVPVSYKVLYYLKCWWMLVLYAKIGHWIKQIKMKLV